MNQLDAQIQRFKQQNNHASGCNSLTRQPFIPGADVAFIYPCDCFLSTTNPTDEEKVKFVRQMGERFGGVHAQSCNRVNPIREKYRDEYVRLIRNCNCWLSQVDNPAKPAYTEPMTQTPDQPDLSEIKQKVEHAREHALGPHLDTPIYDALAREYDIMHNTYAYFETALAKKLHIMGERNR